MKALIFDNKVVDVSEVGFEVHPSLTWMDAPDGCEKGWNLVNGALKAPAGPTDEEVSSFNRQTRDTLLSETDWIVIKSYERGQNIPAEWELYRQALRDITDHANWPNLSKPDWPTKP
jgi:hypothetical protein